MLAKRRRTAAHQRRRKTADALMVEADATNSATVADVDVSDEDVAVIPAATVVNMVDRGAKAADISSSNIRIRINSP